MFRCVDFIMSKRYLIWMLWPKCWVCYEAYCSHSFFLLHSWPLYRPKSWNNAMYSFWLQKGVKNSTRWNFLIRNPEIVGSFICYFWFMTILSSQKLKNAKYRFWLQKGVKNSIRQDFLIRDPQLVGSFICYFCLKMTRTLTFFGGGEILRVFPPQAVWNL